MNDKSSLYVDESGKSSLVSIDDPFLLTGCIISDSEIATIEGYFKYIKRKFNISDNQPFHCYDIFEHPSTKLPNQKLIELSRALADFIEHIPIKSRVIVIDKSEFREAIGIQSNQQFKGDKKRKEMKEFPYRVMASNLFYWFGKHLADNNSIGGVIADSRRGGDHQLLKTFNLCKEGVPSTFDSETSDNVTENITAICFAEKNFLSGGVEITDLISYISFFKARRLLETFKDRGIDRIWKSIRDDALLEYIDLGKDDVMDYFDIPKNGVHKILKND